MVGEIDLFVTANEYVRDLLAGPIKTTRANAVQEPLHSYGPSPNGIGWRYVATAEVPRQIQQVMVDSWLRDAFRKIGREADAAVAIPLHELGEVVLVDERIAGPQRGNLAFIVIHAQDVVSHFGETHRRHQAHITRANYCNLICCLHRS